MKFLGESVLGVAICSYFFFTHMTIYRDSDVKEQGQSQSKRTTSSHQDPNVQSTRFQKLTKESDLVVIAKYLRFDEIPKPDSPEIPRIKRTEDYVKSTFDVLATLIGEAESDQVEVAHYLPSKIPHVWKRDEPGFRFVDEIQLPAFFNVTVQLEDESTTHSIVYDTQTIEPVYLLFLSKNDNGLFTPSSGIDQPGYSCIVLNNQPLGAFIPLDRHRK